MTTGALPVGKLNQYFGKDQAAMTDYTTRIKTNHGHDWVDITAIKVDEFGENAHTVELVFAGRDPVSVNVRYTDIRDVRIIAQALLSAVKWLAPDPKPIPHSSTASEPVAYQMIGDDIELLRADIIDSRAINEALREEIDRLRAVPQSTRNHAGQRDKLADRLIALRMVFNQLAPAWSEITEIAEALRKIGD